MRLALFRDEVVPRSKGFERRKENGINEIARGVHNVCIRSPPNLIVPTSCSGIISLMHIRSYSARCSNIRKVG